MALLVTSLQSTTYVALHLIYQLNQTEWQQIKSNVGFWWEGKTGVPRENLSEQSTEPTNSIHYYDNGSG